MMLNNSNTTLVLFMTVNLPRKWEMDARAFYCKEKWEGIFSLP
jgi:hypothetical protein